jgi:hypothetical protein
MLLQSKVDRERETARTVVIKKEMARGALGHNQAEGND